MKNGKLHQVAPGTDTDLSVWETRLDMGATGEEELEAEIQAHTEEISDIQRRLYAENRQSLLIILQGMDSAGKDSAIKHIMSGVNPQGVSVHSFKHPSTVELEHDFLWRHAVKLPERGLIAIFNRSHYENVLISRVHPEILLAERLPGIERAEQIDEAFWRRRYRQINRFEKNIIQQGTEVLKFFLHLSRDEQRRRFLSRIDNPEKNWKFSSADIAERAYWDDYRHAYEQAFRYTSTRRAPWHIVPADDKQTARWLISRIILEKLRAMNPAFPPVSKEECRMMKQARRKLEAE